MLHETLTQDAVLDKVRARLGALDVRAEQAVLEAIAVLSKTRTSETHTGEEEFISANVSVAQYEDWSPEERFQYLSNAEKINRHWVEKQMQSLHAAWLMVIDGRVVAHGASIHFLPQDTEFDALCEQHGKYPFVFFNPRLFMIEENVPWNQTSEPDDAYPTVAVHLRGAHDQANFVADFDTGAIDAFFDLSLLMQHRLVSLGGRDYERESVHLGKRFRFFAKPLWFSLKGENEKSREVGGFAFCVKDWQNSPFVAVNPNRSALMGRGLFFKLASVIHLDFAARQTRIEIRPKMSS